MNKMRARTFLFAAFIIVAAVLAASVMTGKHMGPVENGILIYIVAFIFLMIGAFVIWDTDDLK